jgi:hypothetical protein
MIVLKCITIKVYTKANRISKNGSVCFSFVGTLLLPYAFIDLPEVTLKAFKEVPIVVKS